VTESTVPLSPSPEAVEPRPGADPSSAAPVGTPVDPPATAASAGTPAVSSSAAARPGADPSSAAPVGTPADPSSGAPTPGGPILTSAEIQKLIPHRWPFLLVDRIVEYDPEARRIVGEKAVTGAEWYFQGHFPGLPVMPGVLQVEALAQTMAVYVARQPGFGDRIGLFAGIDECRFKRVVTPGDVLRLEVTMERLGSRFGRGRGVARVGNEVACEAVLSFVIPPEGVLR
jgi:3-hydroxyacyl-[acyl-carrier-protein] dehydratase